MRIFYFLILQLAIFYSSIAQVSNYSPPENFIAEEDAAVLTYTNENSGAVIQINISEKVDLTLFYNDFNRDQLLDNGLELITESVSIVDDAVKYFFFKCKYLVPADYEGQLTEYMRIIFFTRTNDGLVMAVATFPLIAAELLQTPVIDSFINL